MSDAPVLFDVRGRGGWITLSRPSALNALNLDMVNAMMAQLRQWEGDDRVEFIVIQGLGRAFCAGGDLRMVYEVEKSSQAHLASEFFRAEYALNLYIHNYPKPYISLLHGITMGGGMGISIHGTYRVVTENTLMAMPETAIGFFPDVGAAWYLNRCPGKTGLYLSLTSARIGAADALYTGLATHLVQDLDALSQRLAEASAAAIESILATYSPEMSTASTLKDNQSVIDAHFDQPSLEDIFASLSGSTSDFAVSTLDLLKQRSPLSLRTTFDHFTTLKQASIEEVMDADLKLALRWEGENEFIEGIRAAVIDKDQQPRWKSAAIGA